MKISIGCGDSYDGSENYIHRGERKYLEWEDDLITGWIGIDKGNYGQHYVRDVRRGLPFANDSVDEILAESFLEHIPKEEHFGQDDFAFIMNDCLRVLKRGGKMKIIVPYAGTKSHYKDPTHHRAFTVDTFTYLVQTNSWDYGFDKGWRIIHNERPKNRNEILIVELEKV